MMINLALAILPTIVIGAYILKYDKYNREPVSLLLKLFVYGCLTVIPASMLEKPVDNFPIYSYLDLFLYAFLGVGLIEEGVKYVVTRYIAYKDKAFDEVYDGMIYCVMVSLGFATIENILYVFTFGRETALVRAITAVPAHTIFACTMGYFMGLSKVNTKKSNLYLILSLLVPALLHGIYDFLLFSDLDSMMLIYIVYVIFLYKKTIKLIKETSSRYPFR